MKLVIDSGCDLLVLNLTEKTGVLLEALQDARRFTKTYDAGVKYTPSGTAEQPSSINLELVPDELFGEPIAAIDDLTKSLKQSEKRWLEEYTKRTATEKELEELRAKAKPLASALHPSTDEVTE